MLKWVGLGKSCLTIKSIEEKKLLSTVEKAGLLSTLEKAGFTLSKFTWHYTSAAPFLPAYGSAASPELIFSGSSWATTSFSKLDWKKR